MTYEEAIANMTEYEILVFNRYLLNFITDAQLARYLALGKISQSAYDIMIAYKLANV